MSDPAFNAVSLPKEAIDYNDILYDPNAVYLLDFDGVVASGIEDAIYKLPPQPDENKMLAGFARQFGIPCAAMEPRYQRHLLFQELAFRKGLSIEPGPGFDLAKWASENARAFILTARSGWSATKRVRDFIEAHIHPPIELYQLGRTSKRLQVELLCREFSSSPIYYVEDSPAHLSDAAHLEFSNLTLVYCSREIQQHRVTELYKTAFLGEP